MQDYGGNFVQLVNSVPLGRLTAPAVAVITTECTIGEPRRYRSLLPQRDASDV